MLRWFVILLFTAGAARFCYPFAATAINELLLTSRRAAAQQEAKQNAAVQDEQRAEENRALAQMVCARDRIRFKAGKVNQAHVKRHLIGRVVIPKSAVDLPLFDTTNNRSLDQGAGGVTRYAAIRVVARTRYSRFGHMAAYPLNAFSPI